MEFHRFWECPQKHQPRSKYTEVWFTSKVGMDRLAKPGDFGVKSIGTERREMTTSPWDTKILPTIPDEVIHEDEDDEAKHR